MPEPRPSPGYWSGHRPQPPKGFTERLACGARVAELGLDGSSRRAVAVTATHATDRLKRPTSCWTGCHSVILRIATFIVLEHGTAQAQVRTRSRRPSTQETRVLHLLVLEPNGRNFGLELSLHAGVSNGTI